MTGPTTQEYQPLSQALQFQSQPPDLPRLQLAPPQHHKQLQAQAQAKHETQVRQDSSSSPRGQHADEHATSISSSREVSPAVGVEDSQTSSGQKRKSNPTKGANSKKRKTDQTQEHASDTSVHYGLGTHYPYAYTYPGAPPPPQVPSFHPPPQTPNAQTDMSFNEFQWRLLNLCGEFYEAATELIRSTPHLVLSQAFQVLDRGTGMDPITVLNDARRTCDMLLTNPQALSTAPPPPTALPLPVLTSLAHLNSRPSASSVPAPGLAASAVPPSYYSPPSTSTVVESSMAKGKERDRTTNNVQGTWKDDEIQKLKALAEKYKSVGNVAVAEEEEEEEESVSGADGNAEVVNGENVLKTLKKIKSSEPSEVDWDKVVEEFGDGRSRHQVLIKATYLGLKPSSSLPGKKPKKKRAASNSGLPPPLTFSSANAKSIPSGYNPLPPENAQSSSLALDAPTGTHPAMSTQSKHAAAYTGTNELHKIVAAPQLPAPPQHHPHGPSPYGQPGWYPHPQNPYYAYHQPMYYSPHPQGYGMQGYGMQPPPQGYYAPPYAIPTGAEASPSVEKPSQMKGKRKEARKEHTSTATTSTLPIPPPSLPPRTPTVDATSSASGPTPTSSAVGGSKPTDAHTSGASTPQPAPSAGTPTGTSSSGVLRRGPNNSLFTYTPLPHGVSGASTEQAKEV